MISMAGEGQVPSAGRSQVHFLVRPGSYFPVPAVRFSTARRARTSQCWPPLRRPPAGLGIDRPSTVLRCKEARDDHRHGSIQDLAFLRQRSSPGRAETRGFRPGGARSRGQPERPCSAGTRAARQSAVLASFGEEPPTEHERGDVKPEGVGDVAFGSCPIQPVSRTTKELEVWARPQRGAALRIPAGPKTVRRDPSRGYFRLVPSPPSRILRCGNLKRSFQFCMCHSIRRPTQWQRKQPKMTSIAGTGTLRS